MQPRPIAETIAPPRPSFRCFMCVKFRLSPLSRSQNRPALVLQSFSSHRWLGVETQVSRHATFAAENSSPRVSHRLYRQAQDDRGDEDAPEPGGCVRYAAGTRSNWPALPSERRDIQFWRHGRAMRSRSFVVDARDVARFFLRLRLSFYAIFQQPGQDKSFP